MCPVLVDGDGGATFPPLRPSVGDRAPRPARLRARRNHRVGARDSSSNSLRTSWTKRSLPSKPTRLQKAWSSLSVSEQRPRSCYQSRKIYTGWSSLGKMKALPAYRGDVSFQALLNGFQPLANGGDVTFQVVKEVARMKHLLPNLRRNVEPGLLIRGVTRMVVRRVWSEAPPSARVGSKHRRAPESGGGRIGDGQAVDARGSTNL
jgi:hypothetical protein